MVVSSRTPEGSPNRCPLCGSVVRIEPSLFFGDAPCPACGHLLWFLHVHSEPRFFLPAEAEPIRERLLHLIAEQLGVRRELLDPSSLPRLINDQGADSLDMVELVMELADEFD